MGMTVVEHCYELEGWFLENTLRDVGDPSRVHCPCDFTSVGQGAATREHVHVGGKGTCEMEGISLDDCLQNASRHRWTMKVGRGCVLTATTTHGLTGELRRDRRR
jgi:hypothetical protein